jgi:dCTP deaminase
VAVAGPTLDDLKLPGGGIFASQHLARAMDQDVIRSADEAQLRDGLQPASVDLHLGDVAYRLRCSFLPGTATVEERLEDFGMGEVSLAQGGAVLERETPYLIPLAEELQLPAEIRAKANPKSSTGRVDVFTRLVTDRGERFDEVAEGYTGRLYLEVTSSTFTIKVHPGLALNQLRMAWGHAPVSDAELLAMHQTDHILFRHGAPVASADFRQSHGVFMGLDFSQDTAEPDGIVGYRARRNSRLLDLANIGGHDPADYWDPVHVERGGLVVLEPDQFYLLLSEEAIRIPDHLAGEMAAYDTMSGELRTHYAGFFDPGFGDDAGVLSGSKAALEVRAHDVPFMVEHGQRVCKLAFERLIEPTEISYGSQISSNYQGQRSTLSKHFRRG